MNRQPNHKVPESDSLPEPLLNSFQLAELLSISEISVRRRGISGEFPVIRIGRAVRYRASEVLAALDGSR